MQLSDVTIQNLQLRPTTKSLCAWSAVVCCNGVPRVQAEHFGEEGSLRISPFGRTTPIEALKWAYFLNRLVEDTLDRPMWGMGLETLLGGMVEGITALEALQIYQTIWEGM